MGTAIIEIRFPETLKFCAWFKKEQREEGLECLYLSVSNLRSTFGFGRSVRFTPQLIAKIESAITSDISLDFSEVEKVCSEFNNLEEMIARGEVFGSPPSIDESNKPDDSVLKIIEGVCIP